jgi:trehalose 6-phosphate phosphatase
MQVAIAPNDALFLDIDGTLLEIAETPGLVVVPPDLPGRLSALRARLGGALAMISGRDLASIDRFFPERLAAAAEHGAIIRDSAGQVHEVTGRPAAYEHWLAVLQMAAKTMPGVLIEPKTRGIAIHFRQAPQSAEAIKILATRLMAEAGPDAVLLPAHMAYELRAAGATKDAALNWFMREPPFAGKKPIFVGDDTTDEPAIALATALGGAGLHVHRDFGGSVAAVRAWLAAAA